MSSTTHNDCIDLQWVSVPLRPMSGATVLRYWMDPLRDEKAKQIRDLNRLIQGRVAMSVRSLLNFDLVS